MSTNDPNRNRRVTEHQHGNGGVTEAMNRVLQAERNATLSMEAASGQAAEIIAAARVERDRILARAERRLTRLRKLVATQLANEIRRLQTTAARAAGETGRDGDEERLRAAVERVALRLTDAVDEE
jgi:vacuolar-type H+-ATPase subunit H